MDLVENPGMHTKRICFVYHSAMGIVKISDQMHESLRLASHALSRSINAQAEHWMRIGLLAELHPDLDHRDICRLLIGAEQAGGLDLAAALAAAPSVRSSAA